MIGVIMIFSSSAILAQEKYGNMYFFAVRQCMWVILGSAAMFIAAKLNYRIWAKLSGAGIAVVAVLLLIVLLPSVGHFVRGARRWIRIGSVGFQPAELAKIVVVIYMSSLLDRKFSKIESFYKSMFIPLVLICGIILLIYKQPDFGTAVVIMLMVVGMLFWGGVKFKHLMVGGLFLVPFLIYALITVAYRRERVMSFLKPFENIYGSGFQLAHSIVALGDGGLYGVGPGGGHQKLFFIPDVHTDFVFAVIGQELGFIGAVGVMLLFVIFTWRGIVIALKSREYLGKIMAGGLTFLISLQAVLNIGVVTGSIPTTGLTLPFVGFGGSSLFFNMFAVGVLLNISRENG